MQFFPACGDETKSWVYALEAPGFGKSFHCGLFIFFMTICCWRVGWREQDMQERTKSLAAYDGLTDRIEEYRALGTGLADDGPIDEANAALEQDLEQHESDEAQHRMDLAVYTATRSGLQTGEDALNQAESAFQEGKAQYLAGLKLFEEQEKAFWEGYEQFQQGKKQLEEGAKTLALAKADPERPPESAGAEQKPGLYPGERR